MKGTNNTLADGQTRCDPRVLTRRPDVNWQSHLLEILRVDTQPDALRDHFEELMKEVGGCFLVGGTR